MLLSLLMDERAGRKKGEKTNWRIEGKGRGKRRWVEGTSSYGVFFRNQMSYKGIMVVVLYVAWLSRADQRLQD